MRSLNWKYITVLMSTIYNSYKITRYIMPHKNYRVFDGRRRKLHDMFGQSKSLAGSAVHAIIKWVICSLFKKLWEYGCN